MNTNRGQTATEYLIILAVVILIGIIVVSVLGGIPGLGSGTSERASTTSLQFLDIGITHHELSINQTTNGTATFTLSNSLGGSVDIQEITLQPDHGVNCTGVQATISLGGVTTLTCPIQNSNLLVGDRYTSTISIVYRDRRGTGSQTQNAEISGSITAKN